MDENDILTPRRFGRAFKIIITESICVGIIIAAVLAIKYFSPLYGEIKSWYTENLCCDTDIDEVLKPGGDKANEV